MKHLKMLGLAAVATMALMALVGTGTASAAGGVLCEDIEEPCPANEKWAVNTHMTLPLKAGTLTKITATDGSVLVECNKEPKITGKVLSAGTNAERARLEVQKEWLTWGECTTPTTTVTPGELEFEYRVEPGTKGTVFAKNFVIRVEVFGVRCHYKAGAGTDIGLYTPGKEGKDGILAVTAVTLLENTVAHPSNAIICPSTIKWDGEYTLSGTTPLYIKGE